MVQPQLPVPLPAVLQGRYRAGPLIGHGGASSVYRARDVLLGRDVAIKFFKTPAIDPKDLQAQEGEARLLGAFEPPGLVTLLDAGVELTDAAAPRVFLVMEYVEGPDLRQRFARARCRHSRSPTSGGTFSARWPMSTSTGSSIAT